MIFRIFEEHTFHLDRQSLRNIITFFNSNYEEMRLYYGIILIIHLKITKYLKRRKEELTEKHSSIH